MQSLPRAPFISLFALLSLPSVLLAQSEEITFHKDIEPILQANCQGCHRPGGAGPMPMLTYEQVAPFAGLIEYKTGLRDQAGAMPPWYIEKDIGIQDYKDDMSLSEEEILTISAWARSGSPQGDPADAPGLLEFDDSVKWTLGEPDLIVALPEVSMEAGISDRWSSLPAVPTGLTEDRYVKSVEMVEVNDLDMSKILGVVGGRWIIHHLDWQTAVVDDEGNEVPGFIKAVWPVHEVGRNGDTFNSRAAPLLEANTVIFSPTIHMHSTGFDTTGHLELGFRFHEKDYVPEYRETRVILGNGQDISLRPNESGQPLHAYQTLEEHTKLVAFEPHLHAPGDRMCIEAIWGSSIETLTCSGYDHNWVRSYAYGDDAAPLLPKGTILHLYAENDNSTNNINVVDPRNWAGSGNRSMSNMFVDLGRRVHLTDEQFLREMAERREALDLGPNDHVIGCPLCTAPLVSAVSLKEFGPDDAAYQTIIGILTEMNQSPNDEQKAALIAIANTDDPKIHRVTQGLAALLASVEGTLVFDDRASVERIVTMSDRFPEQYTAVARALLGFDGVISAEDKAALLSLDL